MGRGIHVWTEEKIDELFRQGRGRGDGAQYQPFRKVGDFYSNGTTSELPSHRFGRPIHLFSEAETDTFKLLERSKKIKGLKEQYPVPRQLTLEVAHALKISHPYYEGTNVPKVMTIDFKLDLDDERGPCEEAWSVKCADQADWLYVLEQEEILRTACQQLGVTYRLVIEKLLPASVVKNLGWIRRSLPDLQLTNFDAAFWRDHQRLLLQDMRERRFNGLLGAFCEDYDRRNGAEKGTAIRTVRILLACRALSMDLHNPAQEMTPMTCFHVVDGAPIETFAEPVR